jgi:MerR family transcriptional regulator, redox-sensitive transcriptional activator SoxR
VTSSSTPPLLSIGDVARLSRTPITTLRYYESIGLLPAPARQSGQRRYDASVLRQLMIIRFGKVAGLTVAEIATVLSDRDRSRKVTRSIAQAQIEKIDEQIEQLRLARRMMTAAVSCTCVDLVACSCGALDPVIAELRAALASELGPTKRPGVS